MPQNLTFASIVAPPDSGQTADSRPRVWGRGNLGANEPCIRAGSSKPLNIGHRFYATLCNGDHVARDERQNSERRLRVDDKGLEISIVDPDEVRVERKSEVELPLITNLEENFQTHVVGGSEKIASTIRHDSPHDHERRRGTERTCLDNLQDINVKILFQDGQANRAASAKEILVGASKACGLSEH